MCAPYHQAPLVDLTKMVAALLVRPICTNTPITQKGGRR